MKPRDWKLILLGAALFSCCVACSPNNAGGAATTPAATTNEARIEPRSTPVRVYPSPTAVSEDSAYPVFVPTMPSPRVYPEPILEETQTAAQNGQPNPQIPPTPMGTPAAPLIPTSDLDIHFVDRLHGWLTGRAYWGDETVRALASTQDGGETWQGLQLPAEAKAHGSGRLAWLFDAQVLNVRFADAQNGWLSLHGLYLSQDGGHSWQPQDAPGSFYWIGRSNHDSLWALEQVGDVWRLWQVEGHSYQEWALLADRLPMAMAPASLAVIDAQHIWISYWIWMKTEADQPDEGNYLFKTNDGGVHWERVVPPKYCTRFPQDIAPLDTRNIWMGCGLPGGAGSGIGTAYFSYDGGENWTSKYYNTIGYFMGLTAVSESFIYMSYDRSPSAIITHDGGETWVEKVLYCPWGKPSIDFLDERQGWAVCDSTVNRTVDGGENWECINLPGKQACPIFPDQ